VVAQGGLNRRLAGQWGLPGAVLLNTVVLLGVVLTLFALMSAVPSLFPEGFGGRPQLRGFSPWYLLPGVLGFVIVLGMPVAIARLGAVQSVLLLIAAQLVASLAWDALVEGRPATLVRVVGSVLAVAGAALVVLKG
jgi:bacterial/archaeal transporter family-2 protein